METKKPDINEVIWIDKNVFNDENQGYKKIMQEKYGLKVREYNDAKLGIEAIKKTETYSPIFIITSGSIYPEFYKFFKAAVTYIKNLPVQIIFTSNANNFIITHKNDEIGRQIGKFYNLGGVTDVFPQVENFIQTVIKALRDYKVKCPYTYTRSQDFTGLQTFTYLYENKTLHLPHFYKSILNKNKIDYSEISALIHFMLENFANEKICNLLKGMILFNDIPEPILSKFFARAYTIESPFYGIMNQNLMKRNYKVYSTYIKLLYKGITNKSYPPKTDCTLYRGTKLEQFEIKFLYDILKKKEMKKEVPIIYCTSFLSFSTNFDVSEKLMERRIIDEEHARKKELSIVVEGQEEEEEKKEPIIKLQPLKKENKPLINNNEQKKIAKNTTKKNSKSVKKISKQFIKMNKSPKKIIQKKNVIEAEPHFSSNEVIIKLNPLKEREKDSIMITNGFLNKISFFHQEDEVLFFPFSSFELVDIYDYEGNKMIELDYSPRFIKKIENCVFYDKLK